MGLQKASLRAGGTAWQLPSPRQGMSHGLAGTSRWAAPSQLFLRWRKAGTGSRGHGAVTFTLVSPRQERANGFTGFIKNRRRKSFLYRHHETHQYGTGQGRFSRWHTEIAELLLQPCCRRLLSSRKKGPPPMKESMRSMHTLPAHQSWSMEAMHLLPTYSERAHSSREITSVHLQKTGTHLAAATWYLLLEMSQQVICQQLQR